MNQLKHMTKEQKKPYQVQMTLLSFGPVSVVGLCRCSGDGGRGGGVDDAANRFVSL
jgi:hypothetical protein